jgi:hypothetical protein
MSISTNPLEEQSKAERFIETYPSKIELFAEKYLTHVKGKMGGKPLIFAEWQRNLLRPIFNVTDEEGKRIAPTWAVLPPFKST